MTSLDWLSWARYCDTTTVREELCCLQPMPDTTRGEDVARVITRHFEQRGVDMRKVFAVTTDGAPSMVGKQKGAVKLIEEKVGHPRHEIPLHNSSGKPVCKNVQYGFQ